MEGAVETRPAGGGCVAEQARTMCEAFQVTAAARADQVALRTIADGVSITFREYAERVRQYAGACHALGVRRGDSVGFVLTNRPEFHLLDTAAMHLGATPFSIYNTSSQDQIAYLLADAGNRVLVTEAAFLDRVQAAIARGRSVEHLIVVDAAADGALTLEDLDSADPGPEFDFDAAWRAVSGEDVLTLIYTSGTTGPPKGVQLTHANELAECRGVDAVLQPVLGGHVVSFLPHAHIADRGLTHYGQMWWGHTITCCPDTTQVFAHVADCRPTFFGSVPRVWEKLKAALEAGIAAEPDETKRTGTLRAIELGLRKVRAEQAGSPVSEEVRSAFALAEERVFSMLRERLGLGRCTRFMVGAAPSPLEVLEFFAAIGIPICEVWGMSELSSIATLVPLDRLKLGTVGPAIRGVEVRLAEDGEVLVRGATVMAGQAVAVGDRRPYNVALIVLDPDACGAFAAAHGLADPSCASMAAETAVLREVADGVERANAHLSRVEQIKRHVVLGVDWQPAGDELTPTMKLKRRVIATKYADEIEALYA